MVEPNESIVIARFDDTGESMHIAFEAKSVTAPMLACLCIELIEQIATREDITADETFQKLSSLYPILKPTRRIVEEEIVK